MKKITLLFLLLPFLGLGQVQIGQDIDGEDALNRFGRSVALSSNGNILAVGASGNNFDSGHVRIYENEYETWTQVGEDIDAEAFEDLSGWSVALSSDGSVVVIGAIGNNNFRGQVRIYQNNSGSWTQIGDDIEGEAEGDNFGRSVAISANGSIVAIGANANGGNGFNSGHVKIYQNNSGTWAQIGNDIDGESTDDQSGWSVALSLDGSIVGIGAIGNNSNTGHVRVYQNNSDSWTQVGDDIDGESAGDFSGRSVAISAEGNIIAIGANFNNGNGSNSGHVRIYENQSGSWSQIGDDIDGESASDFSGRSVSLSANGNIVAIGANLNNDNGNAAGHVRIYQNQSDTWIKLGEDIDGEASEDESGISVTLSSNGAVTAIGATGNQGSAFRSGHVRVYDLSALLSTNDLSIVQFNLYPNPTKNQFTIQLESSVQLEKVIIYNTLGQVVLISEEKTINTSKLSSGSYVVEILTNKGKSSKQLIIN